MAGKVAWFTGLSGAGKTTIALQASEILKERHHKVLLLDGDTVRDIYRHGWTDLTESQDAFAAIEVLERYGWVRLERESTGGRTSFATVPLFLTMPSEKLAGFYFIRWSLPHR